MIKDEGLSFKTQLKIEILPPNKGSKKCLEKSLLCKFCDKLFLYIIFLKLYFFLQIKNSSNCIPKKLTLFHVVENCNYK